jgi:hypothetical protein
MRMTLEFWDFETSTPAFFLHHVAIVGLCALLSYGLVKLLPGAQQNLGAGPGTSLIGTRRTLSGFPL